MTKIKIPIFIFSSILTFHPLVFKLGEKEWGFSAVLMVDVIDNDDAVGAVRGNLSIRQLPEDRKGSRQKSATEKPGGDMSDIAGQRFDIASSCGRDRFFCTKVPGGEVFLCRNVSAGRSDVGGRMVYITILPAINGLRDFRHGDRAGNHAPEEQNQYGEQT